MLHPKKVNMRYMHEAVPSEVTTEQRLLLNLATIIQYNKNPKFWVVDLESQEEAIRIYNELGFVKALDHLFTLGWAEYAGDDD